MEDEQKADEHTSKAQVNYGEDYLFESCLLHAAYHISRLICVRCAVLLDSRWGRLAARRIRS
eukprot:6193498-Pleurochrysis_carterae.AAC.4